jgi:hypothetical protein
MGVGRSSSLLEKMGILRSIQELAMERMTDHVSLVGSITNSSVEGVSWRNGCMDLFDLKNSSEGHTWSQFEFQMILIIELNIIAHINAKKNIMQRHECNKQI